MPYRTSSAVDELNKIGWRNYSKKHGESIFTKFFQNYYLPKRFGYDKRKLHYSSRILSGDMTRNEAVTGLAKPLYDEIELKNDIDYLDSPVSGGTFAANDVNLAIMVGGEEKVFLETKKILGAMGRPILVGPTGAGQLAKLANQAIVGITISAVAEAVLLLERGGANLDSVRDALSGGFADSAILQQHGQRMSKRNFETGGSVRTQLKDLQNIQKVAQILGLELPMVNKVTERYSALSANSLNLEKDHSALFLELLDRNKITD